MMEIVVHPARARPARTLVLVAFVAIAAWTLAAFTAPAFGVSVGACALGVGALFAFTLRAWLLPTRYLFDDDGIEIAALTSRRYAWNRFRGWRKERGGWYLSPFTDPTRFDHFRGLYLYVDGLVVGASEADVDGALERLLSSRIPPRGGGAEEQVPSAVNRFRR